MTFYGYTKDQFDDTSDNSQRRERFKIAVASVWKISSEAIEILKVNVAYYSGTRRLRRTLLTNNVEGITVDFKVATESADESDDLIKTALPKGVILEKFKLAGLVDIETDAAGNLLGGDLVVERVNNPPAPPPSVVLFPPTPLSPPSPPPPFPSPSPPPSTLSSIIAAVTTENSASDDSTTLIGAAVGAISLPGIILFLMKVFASKALRGILLRAGMRRLADMIVPDMKGTMNEFNVKMKDVETFMSKQKLPRLVETTPVLDEENITVNSSKTLGRGGFGIVFRGTLKRSSTGTSIPVAVKCMFNPTNNPKDAVVPEEIKKQMSRESTILCSLNHPNVMKIFGVVPERGWIVMELCDRGSLKSILLDRDNQIELSELVRYAAETATGVAYLHTPEVSIIHGDLKADNVLVRENGSVCLCDFGMSEAKDRSKTLTQAVGVSAQGGLTIQWSSPELLKGRGKDRASDVFALAVTLWEIFERMTPFSGMADMIVINQILANVRPDFEKTPSEFKSLIARAWTDDAKARPNAAQMAYALSN